MVRPALVGVALLVFTVLLLRGATLLRSVDETYSGQGEFNVERCTIAERAVGGQVRCQGLLTPEDASEPVASVMIGPQSSFGSSLPPPGSSVDSYYRVGDPSTSYPMSGRNAELVRLFVGVVPLTFLVGGLACWLLGWVLTRDISRDDAERRTDRYRFPARFMLRPRGALWAMVGLVWFGFDVLVVDQLFGSAGLG